MHILRQIGSLVVTAVTAASTLNAYRPLARSGYLSLFSFMFGLVVTELPLQTLASQLGGLALTARRLTRPVRTIAWLVAGVSALGLLNFNRAGHKANVPLTAALDDGLGPVSSHRVRGSVAPADRQWHRQDAGTAADAADLP